MLLSGTVVKLTREYFAQREAGQEPVFHSEDYPEHTGEIDREIWRR